jgi:hypothetical protein
MLSRSQIFIRNLAKLLFFFALLIISDQIIGKLLRNLYFNQKSGQQQVLTFVLSEVKSNILILGNSRAQHHYDSQILSDSLHMTCYNAGLDGGHSILLPYGQIKVLLQRYSPKLIILEIDPSAFEYDKGDYERLSIFLPYAKEYPELQKLVCLRSPFERFKLISAIYPFNSSIISILRFNTNLSPKITYNGYVPIFNKQLDASTYKSFISKYAQIEKTHRTFDTVKINALKQIKLLCENKGIRLALVCSPFFQSKNDNPIYSNESIKDALSEVCDEDFEIYDFKSDPRFNNHFDLFADYSHLNDSGAKLFTSYLAAILKSKDYYGSSE